MNRSPVLVDALRKAGVDPAGDGTSRDAIERARQHSEDTKLARSGFIFAESAHYPMTGHP